MPRATVVGMDRVRITYPLLVGILLGSSLPVLVLVQYLLNRGGAGETWLESRLAVSQEGAQPLLHSTDLRPEGQDPLTVSGTGRLLQDAFPWEPSSVQATFTLRLTPEILGVVGEHTTGWSASYRERDTTRADGLGIPPLPCVGRVVVKVAEGRRGAAPVNALDMEALELALELRCRSAGADLIWHTGDERVWTVEGPISLRRGRR